MMKQTDALTKRLYDNLWHEAKLSFSSGNVEVDPFLVNRHKDRRLGVTVIARPPANVLEQLGQFVRCLEKILPGQYFYQPGEMHLTVLSLFTAVEDYDPFFSRLSEYLEICQRVLPAASRFEVDFFGITASRSSIMIQGFPRDLHLEELRDKLREALIRAELDERLDTRYRITTAHSTLMRFMREPADCPSLVSLLEEYREFPFGSATVESLQVVKNDWYMSQAKTELLAEYVLRQFDRS